MYIYNEWVVMNLPKGVKSGVPERVSISCSTCGTIHESHNIFGNQACIIFSEQTRQHMWHKYKICSQGLQWRQYNSLKVFWYNYIYVQNIIDSIILKPEDFSYFDHVNCEQHYMQGIPEYVLLKYGKCREISHHICHRVVSNVYILIKPQTKVNIISPFWNIWRVFNIKHRWIYNLNIIIEFWAITELQQTINTLSYIILHHHIPTTLSH